MGKLIAFDSITLDGVMRAPGAPEEDTRAGFTHGGWATPTSTRPCSSSPPVARSPSR